MAKATRKTVST